MSKRPTRRAAVLIGVAVLLVLAGSTAQAGWLFVLAAGVAGLVLVSLFWPHRLKSVSVRRTLPATVQAGETFSGRIDLINTSRRSLSPLRAKDEVPGIAPAEVSLLQQLGPGATAGGSVRIEALRRGVHEGGSVTLRSGAPFGIVMSRRKLELPGRIVVTPRTVQLRSFPLDLVSTSYGGEEEALRIGVGDEFLGVRPYRTGDPRRSVHWRSTARAGQLIVREFQEPSRLSVEIVVAGLAPSEKADSSFETIVSAAASAALYMISLGHPLTLAFFDADGPQRRQVISERSILEALAAAVPADRRLDELTSEGSRSALAVFVTTSGAPGESLASFVGAAQRSGRRVTAVLADSASWDEAGAPLRRPASHGVTTRCLKKDEEIAACLAA
jgi:uncharacterized protein (DUF58 family)